LITRLQLGISHLRNMSPAALEVFLDRSWMHFGDAGSPEEELRGVNGALRRLKRVIRRESPPDIAAYLARTNFQEFYFEKGDRLPFDDASLDFVFSEHFLEHLFLDEAVALLRECHRVLRPRGVVRTCVPDADLRSYESPERAGFPGPETPWNDPFKHKTRWSVHSLPVTLELTGFSPVPLRYCDQEGNYVKRDPRDVAGSYEGCPDPDVVFDLGYIMRPDSLLVDGVRA
jgi:SAM-dependent methyltransferase